ncbi:MAG: glycosyltransferase, partial [Myxococcota bacterium]
MSNAEGVSLPRRLGQGIAVVLALAAAAMVVVVPLDLESQVLFGVLGFGVALVLGRFRGPKVDLLLIVMSLVISTRYIHWRITMTLPEEWSFDLLFGGLLLMAELYAFAVLFLGYFQTARPFRRRPVPLPSDPSTWPVVDIFIPTYNEPLKVVRATALAAKAIDWPADKLRVYILDDGGRDTGWKTDAHRQRARERNRAFSVFCREAGIYYVTRPDNSHAKAGNLNHALAKTSGEFIAIFDCDHVPTRSFLQMTMGWMLREPQLALLQTPHHFYSADPVEKNLGRFRKLPNEGELFYGLIQPGNDLWDATFFCGSCAVIRRAPLEEVGGIAVETVTEDAHTALKMQRRGWSTAYLDVPHAAGLATESLSAHVGQRIRWARGMAQIFRTDNPVLGRGLRWHQRLCYTSAMLYFFYGVPRLVFLLAPLSFLVFDLQILNATPYLVLAYAFPH